jgi:hypothetical protein
VDLLPLESHSAPSNGAGANIVLRSINISPPNGVNLYSDVCQLASQLFD